jgi:hypothetical protein
MTAASSLDTDLRKWVYAITRQRGTPPTISELTTATHATPAEIRAALARLASGRVLVLQPSSGEILMAPPFSAVPTPFVVHTRAHQSYANCAWDAFGVPAMLHEAARITTACGCCGEAISVHTRVDQPPEEHEENAVMHFAVPANRWWEDIVFT